MKKANQNIEIAKFEEYQDFTIVGEYLEDADKLKI
jgi:hypothetical protein